jgi:hypothetical protein
MDSSKFFYKKSLSVMKFLLFKSILKIYFIFSQKLRRKKTPAEILRNEMQYAKTYEEWNKKAQELDK